MLARRYEMPWRSAYESYAGMGWLAAMLFFAVVGAQQQLPCLLALPLAVLCFCMGVLRLAQAVRTLVLRASLSGRSIQVITTSELARWCRKPDQVFLGFGFEWCPVHS
jgi:conjugal transfer pilus assembly protein TraD